MIKIEKYKRCERDLYNYIRNSYKLIALKERYNELIHDMDVHAQSYSENHMPPGNYSDPAGEYAEKCITIERQIKYFEQKIIPVELMKKDLQDFQHIGHNGILYTILIRVFFWHMKANDFCLHFNIARRTFYRRKTELVRMAEKYFE